VRQYRDNSTPANRVIVLLFAVAAMVHRGFITYTSTVSTYHLLTLGRLRPCTTVPFSACKQHNLPIYPLCRDLETKIDQEQSRVSSNNHERIKQDLEAIAQENAQLVAQIKAAAANKGHK
jgi:hypothetical protein